MKKIAADKNYRMLNRMLKNAAGPQPFAHGHDLTPGAISGRTGSRPKR
jgi:hypothetical protein